MRSRAVVPLALTLFAACAVEKAPPAPPAEAPEPAELTIRTTDYAFTAPDTVAPGVTKIRLVNDGQHAHHAILARIDSGKTLADAQAAMMAEQQPAWVVFLGGDGVVKPGKESTTVTTLTPGLYVLFCFMQDAPDQPPHIVQGMVRPIVVAGEPGLAVSPKPTAEIQLVDFDFVLPTLMAGPQTIRVVNNGTQVHEVAIMRIPDGMTLEAFKQEMANEHPQAGEELGGNGALSPGESNLWLTNLTPGNYAVTCFVPSPDDKVRHVMKGMVKLFTIPSAAS